MVRETEARARARSVLMRDCDAWDQPSSRWEVEAVNAVVMLPRVTVERVPTNQSLSCGMQPNDCHNNAIWYAANDPARLSEHIVGWWPHGDLLLLHSVIRNGARYFCITPQEAETEEQFTFIPDRAISSGVGSAERSYFRNGREIGLGLRLNAEVHRAAVQLLRERLRAGMSTQLALELGDQEAAGRVEMMRW